MRSVRPLSSAPDAVFIRSAMNDSSVPGYRDRDMPGYTESISFPTRIARALRAGLRKIETYKLLHYLALLLREKPKSIGEHIRTEAAAAEGQWEVGKRRVFEQRDYEKVEPWTRVSPADY